MNERAQSLRGSLPPGSIVRVTTETEQHIGEIVEITDYYLILKTSPLSRRADTLIALEDARAIKIISQNPPGPFSGATPSPNSATTPPSDKQFEARRRGQESAARQPAPEARNRLRPLSPARQDTPIHNTSPRSTANQLFREAQEKLFQKNDHSNAIKITRQLLSIEPDYPGAQSFLEQCLEIARRKNTREKPASDPYPVQTKVQRTDTGSSNTQNTRRSKHFALALEATSDEEAIQHLYRAIEYREPKAPSAVKDLANRLAARGRGQEAIDVLTQNRAMIRDQQSVDNLLTHIYIKFKRYEEALALLEKKHRATPSAKRDIETLKKIADCYMRVKQYKEAIPYLQDILNDNNENKDPVLDNKSTLKRLALCYLQEQLYATTEEILYKLLEVSPDDEQIQQLHELLQEARSTGQINEGIAENLFTDAQNESDGFANFFLKRCEFRGVPSTRLQEKIQEKNFDPSDIDRLEKLAIGAINARNYSDSAEFYLSAANIVTIQGWTDKSDLYTYLYHSFASRGDASLKNKSLDTVREWYCEALYNYDKMHHKNGDEKEAIKTIVKFLYSIRGGDAIPTHVHMLSVEHALYDICGQGQQSAEFFTALAYLTSRSKKARQLILPWIFVQTVIREQAFHYLFDALGLSVRPQEYNDHKLTELWSLLDKKNRIAREGIHNEIRRIATLEMKHSQADTIEEAIERIRTLKDRLFHQLDRDRLAQLSTILSLTLHFFKETSFGQREYLCTQMDKQCRSLLVQIANEPTKLSIDGLYQTIEAIQRKVNKSLEHIYANSEPSLTLDQELSSYTPDIHRKITVQINVTNGIYCSPAESVELQIAGIPNPFFEVESQTIPLKSGPSLQGGDKGQFSIPLCVSDQALREEAFSLPVSLHYCNRSGATRTYHKPFHIQLNKKPFEEIDPNPYEPHIRGTPVTDRKMFVGRDEFITKIARSITTAESRAVVIYGQKRTGKSSILYHLKPELEKDRRLLVAKVGSIADNDTDLSMPPLYQLLWQILFAIKIALLERDEGSEELLLSISFPESSASFLNHPSPLTYFQEILTNFRSLTQRTQAWEDVRIVLLIDEFQSIYELIKKKRLDASFMNTWKALLEKQLFNAVLVGHNGMKKFKKAFANVFDTMHEEPVSYLEDKDARQLIEEPISPKDGSGRYREEAVKRILALTASSPYYIQIFCYYLVEYINRKQINLVTDAVVEEVKLSLLKGKYATFRSEDDFDNLIKSGDPDEDAAYWADAVQIMACIAKKSLASPCLRKEIDCAIEPQRIDAILDDFTGSGVLQRDSGLSGQSYSLYVGLFQEWLNIHR